jgi:hypothetical protein
MSEFPTPRHTSPRTPGRGATGQGPWHWAPCDTAPAHESICEDCGGRLHLFWDQEVLMWLADGDLIVCKCSESGL